MKDYIEERAITLSEYIVEKKTTVRDTARIFNISKSTVHKDVSERIWQIDKELAKKVQEILSYNKADRHLRWGNATKHKYEWLKNNKKSSVWCGRFFCLFTI